LTEVPFSAVPPPLARALGRSPRVPAALVAISAMGYAGVALFLPAPPFEPWLRAQSIIGRGPLFLFGILGAWLYRRHGEAIRTSLAANRWLASGGADLVLVIVFLALALLLRWSNLRGFFVLEPTRWYVWHV